MLRTLKFLHVWNNFKFLHVKYVKKCEIYPYLVCVWCWKRLHISKIHAFCCKIGFVAIYALLKKNLLSRNLRTFVWRKITEKLCMWWKITNMRYGPVPWRRSASPRGKEYSPSRDGFGGQQRNRHPGSTAPLYWPIKSRGDKFWTSSGEGGGFLGGNTGDFFNFLFATINWVHVHT